MSPQTALAFTETPQRIDQTWVVAMPKEIAEDLFGVPAGSLVTLFARSGEITALMNLATQTEEARRREPGWFLDMPSDMAAAAGFAPALVGPQDGKPVMLDDTCYFLPFDDERTARSAFAALRSEIALDFFAARIFWDAKRPIRKSILQTLDLRKLEATMRGCSKA